MPESTDDKTTLSQDTLERARQAAPPRASLVVYHRDQVKIMPLADSGELVVGRAWPSDMVIQDPSLSLTEISYLLGFSEPSSFTRAFRGWTGQSPSEARNATPAI